MNEFDTYAVNLATLIAVRLGEGKLLNPDIFSSQAISTIIDCIVEVMKNTKEEDNVKTN